MAMLPGPPPINIGMYPETKMALNQTWMGWFINLYTYLKATAAAAGTVGSAILPNPVRTITTGSASASTTLHNTTAYYSTYAFYGTASAGGSAVFAYSRDNVTYFPVSQTFGASVSFSFDILVAPGDYIQCTFIGVGPTLNWTIIPL